jgi:hypothetical protein
MACLAFSEIQPDRIRLECHAQEPSRSKLAARTADYSAPGCEEFPDGVLPESRQSVANPCKVPDRDHQTRQPPAASLLPGDPVSAAASTSRVLLRPERAGGTIAAICAEHDLAGTHR